MNKSCCFLYEEPENCYRLEPHKLWVQADGTVSIQKAETCNFKFQGDKSLERIWILK